MKEHTLKSSCSYGNYLIDLLDEKSALYNDETNVVICFLDIDSFNDEINVVLNALLKLKQKNKMVFINTVSAYPYYMDTYTSQTVLYENEINRKIIEFTKEHCLLLLDFQTIIKRLGVDNSYDSKYWYLGKIKYSALLFQNLAKEIEKLILVQKQSCKKCLVLDLDNTLWKGIIGEGEIELGNDGIGSIYQEFQKNIKALKALGILLAINSKNNLDDALEGLNHPSSILKEEDFILIKANWQHKNENIKAIAHELNIGEDALVFIDDNPVERDLVSNTTDAIVPDFPEDIFTLNEWFIKEVVYMYFYKTEITQEDANKQVQYKAKLQRDAVASTMDYEEFIQSLNIELNFYVDDKKHIQRLTQLTQKTNQFNLTTQRYSVEEIQSFIDSDEYRVIAVDYQDKYAKEGIIALAIIRVCDDEAMIDTFLLSCRVLKRNVEKALVTKIAEVCQCKKTYWKIYRNEKKCHCQRYVL
jgi:FkbH-like protein